MIDISEIENSIVIANNSLSQLESPTEKEIIDRINIMKNLSLEGKSIEDNLEEVLDVSVSFIEQCNYFYYNEELKKQLGGPLVEDDIYERVVDYLKETLKENDSRRYIFKTIGEEIKEEEKFFMNSTHGFYNEKDEMIKRFEAGSMSKTTIDDYLTPEQQEAEREGEEVIPDFSANKDFLNETLTTSDKLDGITLVVTYTDSKEKGINHINKVYNHQKQYINNSEKSEKDKRQLLDYIKIQKDKLLNKIKMVNEGDYFPYKVVTRGDGDIGEDITFNGMNIQRVKYSIPKSQIEKIYGTKNVDFVVRGEAVITEEDFKTIDYKNPRNGVSLIRNQDGKLSEKLTLIPFERIGYDFDTEELIHSDRKEMFNWFEDNGFVIPMNQSAKSMDKIYEIMEKRFKERAANKNWVKLPGGQRVWTDGMIYGIDNAKNRIAKGVVSKKPKGEKAYKPRPERAVGEVDRIEFKVGKTGVITPVIKLKKKVWISGSKVDSFTGNNEEILKELNLYIGALVEFVKRGEIIPKIERNISMEPIVKPLEKFVMEQIIPELKDEKIKEEIRSFYHEGELEKIFNKNISSTIKSSVLKFLKQIIKPKEIQNELTQREEFKLELDKVINQMEKHKETFDKANEFALKYPTICPSCGTELQKEKIYVRCINNSCEGKKMSRLNAFAQALTKGIGEGKIKQLYDLRILKEYKDFFSIKLEDFKEEDEYIKGWKEKSAQKFIDSVNNIRKSKDDIFFGSIFFDGLGRDSFQKLFQNISLKELLPELNQLETKIPEDLIEEKDTLKKVIKKLEDIEYPHLETFKKLTNIKDFAEKKVLRIINTWVEEKEEISNLLNIIELEETKKVQLKEAGSIVITGSLNTVPDSIKSEGSGSDRNLLKSYLKEKGYTVTSSVTGKTLCVIAGEEPTQRKVDQAKEKSIPVFDDINKFAEYFKTLEEKEDKKEVKTKSVNPNI